MANTLTIEGVPAYNGEYPLDLSYFTNHEMRLVKVESGVRAGELTEAFAAGDNDLMVCIAAIVVWRHTGTKPDMEPFWNAEAGKFTLNMEETEPAEDEDESLPPLIAPDEPATTDDDSTDAGATSNGTSDIPENALRAIGAQA